MLDRERYDLASVIFAEACDLSEGQRQQVVRERCGADAELRSLVMAMLDADATDSPDSLTTGVRRELEAMLTAGEGQATGRCGPYTIGTLLGRGGMGEVYEATRTDPHRTVALKLLRGARASPASLRRFRREVASLARLTHPGISQLYDAGTCEAAGMAVPYFAMELVRGEPITAYVRRKDLSVQARLELLARVCDIVQFAHQQGVIHRDLKPSNILVSESDQGEAQIKILDFGIARLMDERDTDRTVLTEQGLAIGTPGYMAPEQAGSGVVDTRADVYAIGALAYVVLTGRPAFDLDGLSTFDAVKRVTEHDPAPLGTVDGRFKGDISLVVATAMQRERERRYATAAELGLDLRRITRHEPVQAREPSALYLLSRFARRHRGLVAAATVGVLALAGFSVVVAVMYRREQTQRLLTEQQRERANAEARMQQEISAFLVADTLGAAAPSRKGASIKVVDVIDDAAAAVDERFASDAVLRGKVRATIANLYYGAGRFHEASATSDKAVTDLRATSVAREVFFSELLRLNAASLASVNRVDDAKARYREAAALADALGEEGKTASFFAQAGLAELLQSRGQHAEAQPMLRKLIAAIPRETTTDHDLASAMVSARTSLAASLGATGGDTNERLELLRDAASVARTNLQPGHPGRLAALGALCNALASTGRAEEALPLTVELLEMLERTFSDDHPNIGKGMLSAAMVHSSAGRHREACDFADRALAIFQKRFPPGDYTVERAAGAAVAVHHAAGDAEGVVRCFRPYLLARLIAAGSGEGEGVVNRMREFCDVIAAWNKDAVAEVLTQFIQDDCLSAPVVIQAGGLERWPNGARLAGNLARGLGPLQNRSPNAQENARELLARANGALAASEHREDDERLLAAVRSEMARW